MSKNEEQTLLENVVARVRKKLKGGCSDEKVLILIVFLRDFLELVEP